MHIDPASIDPTAHALARRCSLGDVLTRSAQTFTDRPAVADSTGTWSYAQLESEANRLAHGLDALGIDAEEPVAILAPNGRHFVAASFAVVKAGMVMMPVNLLAGDVNISHAFNDSGARCAIVHPSQAGMLGTLAENLRGVEVLVVMSDESSEIAGVASRLPHAATVGWSRALGTSDVPPEIPIGDRQIAQCLYTSGTTSAPKGVLTSHLAVTVAAITNALIFRHRWGADHSVVTQVLPLFHTAGFNSVLLSALASGGTVHLLEEYDPEALAHTVARTRSTHFTGLPLMLQEMAAVARRDGLDISSLEMVVYAMAPMSETARAEVEATVPNAHLVLGSGMTECTPTTVLQWPELSPDRAGSWGYPSPSTDNRIAEPGTGTLLQDGEDGEIVYRGPSVMEGYWNNPRANAEAFAGGYLHSGDLGRLDPDHVLWFSDRVKDIIKTGGENVSSLLVERVVSDHPWVAEVACVGVPDPRWGETVAVVVVPTPDAPGDGALVAESVETFAAERLSSSHRPRQTILAPSLPRTATGKIRKVELRSMVTG